VFNPERVQGSSNERQKFPAHLGQFFGGYCSLPPSHQQTSLP
jgi:hypothetical protein